MTELSEKCVKCLGRDIWAKDISEAWRLEKTPPEIWYLKNREEFEKRYRDFLSKIPEVTYINFDKNIGTHVATYINFNTLKEYHDPIVVITEEGISEYEKKIGIDKRRSHGISNYTFFLYGKNGLSVINPDFSIA